MYLKEVIIRDICEILLPFNFHFGTSGNTGGLRLFGKGGALSPRIYRFELNKRDIILTKSVRWISMVKNYGIDFQRLRTRSFHVSVFFGTGIPLWKFLTILFELYRWVRYKVQEGARYKVQEGVLYKVQSTFFRQIFPEGALYKVQLTIW